MSDGLIPGTLFGDRYALAQILGRGGFGLVYRAHDTMLDAPLALKVLTRCEPSYVVDLKREFRAATTLRHPNVVVYHELAEASGSWFFTMELVEGSDLDLWLRGTDAPGVETGTRAVTPSSWTHASGASGGDVAAAQPTRNAAQSTRPLPEVREAFAQIAEGLAAVHAAGALHCDLKPSNVRMALDGRPVLLDFGLARVLGTAPLRRGFRGTPTYAAPEQLDGRPLSVAVDAFALGVMLFEALAGRPPFEGTGAGVIAAKRIGRAPPLAALAPWTPEPIAELVDALLDGDPARRPAAIEVARVLTAPPGGSRPPKAAPSPEPLRASGAPPTIVGRDDSIDATCAALDAPGRTMAVLRGPSGIGKTAVGAAAVSRAIARGAIVLRARCYERERAPYELLDGVGESLVELVDAGHLALEPEAEVLARRAAPIVPSFAARFGASADATNEREDAAMAFTSLLAWLSRQHRLVLYVDDAQWVDADSAWFVRRLFREAMLPTLALLLTLRPLAEVPSRGEGLVEAAENDPHWRTLAVDLQPLGRDAAEALLRARLPAGRLDGATTAAVLEHAAGSPLLLGQLADYVGERRLDEAWSLEAAVSSRLQGLRDPARQLFERAAVAGRPVEERHLLRTLPAGTDAGLAARALFELLHERLLRSEGAAERGHGRVAVWHAAFGAAALTALDASATRTHHAAWASALEVQAPDAEAEVIGRHWLAAGEGARAVPHLQRAGAAAGRAFAFARARELYLLAIEHVGTSEAAEIWTSIGEVLAAEGRGIDAAAAFGRAAQGVAPDAGLDLDRRAAEQLLKSGRIAEGTRALDRVLDRVGMRRARTRSGALIDLIRTRIRARSVQPAAGRPDAFVDAPAARRADAAMSLASGLGFVDPILAADFSSRHYIEGIRSGDPQRRLRALTAEAISASGEGLRAERRVHALLFDARALADRLGHPRARSMIAGAEAITSALLGDFEGSFAAACRADALFSERVRDAPWDHVTSLHFMMWSAFHAGRLDVLTERAPALFAIHAARGDHYGATGLGANYANLAWLLRDRDEAARVLDRAASWWRGEAFNLLQYDIGLARVHHALAAGDAAGALRRANRVWASLRGALFHHVAALRFDASWMRARALVALLRHSRGVSRVELRIRAVRAIAAIASCPVRIAPAVAVLTSACLRGAVGDEEGAAAHLARAVPALERAGLPLLHAHAAHAAARAEASRSRVEPPGGALFASIFLPGLVG